MTQEVNIQYPGRPNYTGPKKGLFGLLHHNWLYEYSWDIMERVKYIKAIKPAHEVETRLHCLVYPSPDRLPKAVKQAGEKYIQTREKRIQAAEKFGKVREKCSQAREKCSQARRKSEQVFEKRAQAEEKFDKAWEKFFQAEKEYEQAREKFDKAWEKFFQVREEYAPQIEALIRELVPDLPWDGKQLVFPPANGEKP